MFHKKHDEQKLEIIASSEDDRLESDSSDERNDDKVADVAEDEIIEHLEFRVSFCPNELEDERKSEESDEHFFIDAYSGNADFKL